MTKIRWNRLAPIFLLTLASSVYAGGGDDNKTKTDEQGFEEVPLLPNQFTSGEECILYTAFVSPLCATCMVNTANCFGCVDNVQANQLRDSIQIASIPGCTIF